MANACRECGAFCQGQRCADCYGKTAGPRIERPEPPMDMRSPDLDVVKGFVGTPRKDEDFFPLLLYRGNLSLGRARALFNMTLAGMEAEARTARDIARISGTLTYSRGLTDVAHLCGLHAPMEPFGYSQFLQRLWDNPEVTSMRSGLRDYLDSLNMRWWPLERISRYSKESTRSWRRPIKTLRRRSTRIVKPLPDVPNFYPFVTHDQKGEHALLMAVDRAVPTSFPSDLRGDLCQDILVDILSDKLTLAQIEGGIPKGYTASIFRRYPHRYQAAHLSIDAAPTWNRDGRSIGETLSNEPANADPAKLYERSERAREIAALIGVTELEQFARLDDDTADWYRQRLAEEGLTPQGIQRNRIVDPVIVKGPPARKPVRDPIERARRQEIAEEAKRTGLKRSAKRTNSTEKHPGRGKGHGRDWN